MFLTRAIIIYMKVSVLHLGHRIERDKRLSTHVALAARALGCSKAFYSGEKDLQLEDSISKVSANWGGSFSVSHVPNALKFIKSWRGEVAHLTVYGIPVQKAMPRLRKSRSLLVVVGGEKVPPEVYHAVGFNVSVAGQPHSEVAALAILLDRLFRGKELEKRFNRAKLRVVPQERGKKVVRA